MAPPRPWRRESVVACRHPGGLEDGMAATTTRTARERPESLRDRVLRAATAEFVELGYHRSSLRRIAARSRATKPMIYYHFGGKDGLYAAAVQHEMEQLEGRLLEA